MIDQRITDYFDTRMNSEDWEYADDQLKERALADAKRRISLVVPWNEPVSDRIIWAQAEIAITLISDDVDDGNIQSIEYDALKVKLNTTKSFVWLDYGIPSKIAWQYLSPYIGENNSITLRRTS